VLPPISYVFSGCFLWCSELLFVLGVYLWRLIKLVIMNPQMDFNNLLNYESSFSFVKDHWFPVFQFAMVLVVWHLFHATFSPIFLGREQPTFLQPSNHCFLCLQERHERWHHGTPSGNVFWWSNWSSWFPGHQHMVTIQFTEYFFISI
jgi:hypothetical protein